MYIHKNLADTNPTPYQINISEASGSKIIDTDGNVYLDFISGISVNNLGHGNPAVIEAVKLQSEKYMHAMVFGEFHQSPQTNLASYLADLLPDNLNTSYFVNSGAEAIEGALKLAKRYTGMTEIISFRGSYHGSTHGALSVSGNERKKTAFRPLLPDIHFLDFNREEQLSRITHNTAAVIIEPIQGDAGVRIPSKDFITALRQRCTETNTLLIFDEIQTGIGRTGKMFAFEHFDIVPDILCSAKALGGGMPIGVFISSSEIMHTLTHSPPLGHITTFGGHPVNCAAALANLKYIKEQNILDTVEQKGALIASLLAHPMVIEIRRIGMFFAIEMKDADQVRQVVEISKKNGLLSFWFLSCPESFRIAPPLNISETDLRNGCEIIRNAFDAVK